MCVMTNFVTVIDGCTLEEITRIKELLHKNMGFHERSTRIRIADENRKEVHDVMENLRGYLL